MADLKQLARQIFLETLAAIDIPAAMERKLLREGSLLHCDDAAIALSAFTKFRVVAIGKAEHAMLDGLRSLLPREIAFEGVACAPTPPPQPVQGIDYFAGGHPIPNQQSLEAAKSILALLRDCDEKLPAALRQWMDQGKMPETPKPDDAAFASAHFVLLLGMDDLFHPAHHASEAKGFFTVCDNTTDDWPVQKAAEYLLGQLDALRSANPGRRVALVADGEVSSPVLGNGIGGRNSAFVLACVENIVARRVAVLSAGTDGIDGNSPAAGAVANGETLGRAMAEGLEPADAFQRSDAYNFFARLGDAIVTGPTGNNLRDLRILLAEP